MYPLAVTYCAHCGKEVLDRGESKFCCLGCETVYAFMSSTGLARYYELRQGAERQIAPGGNSSIDYRYLDDEGFKTKYARGHDRSQIEFFVEGVHCAACIWLIEKLPSIVPDVESAKLDLGKSVATIKVGAGGSFAKVAEKLAWFGYRPHPIESDEKAAELQRAENRSWLMRIGVAAACSGNIMLQAVALYAGLAGEWAVYFRYLSLALFLPVLFYSATPFYKNAIASLRTRTLSIDVPVALAIVLGAIVSTYNLRNEHDHIYFDSLAALVFLLLASRFALKRIQQRNLGGSHLYHFLSPSKAKRLGANASSIVEVNTAALLPGDLIEVGPGEVIPADGVVQAGASAINSALLTGESLPHPVGPGDQVYSGTVNEGGIIRVTVAALGAETRLGKILSQVEGGALKKAPIVIAADRISKWFLLAVFVAAIAVFAASADFSEGVNRALALVIVTCPCALALATPLAMSLSMKKAARRGILINGAEILEKIARVRKVVLDKTGTLTYGSFEVLQWRDLSQGAIRGIDAAVLALEERSKHPVARGLTKFLRERVKSEAAAPKEFKEEAGVGVSGLIGERFFEVRSLKPDDARRFELSGTQVGVYRDGTLVAVAALGDKTRSDAREALKTLGALKLTPYVLSGDNAQVVAAVGKELELPQSHLHAQASPEFKSAFVKEQDPCIMVGDGANDALALSSAYVGVAVHGSMDVSLRAADVYIAQPGLSHVARLAIIARETMRLIHRNFAFSLLYNLAGGLAAATGHMTPLIAALLMPVSAFTVYASTLWGTSRLRKNT